MHLVEQVKSPQQAASGAFVPFTGYTSNIDIPDGTLDPDESNEQNKESQPSPRSISGEQAGQINSSGNGGKGRNSSIKGRWSKNFTC